MRVLLVIAAVAAVLISPVPPSAVAAEPVAAKPSPRALALTRRMIAAMHVEDSMTPMLETMVQAQVAQSVAQNPKLTDQQKAQLTSVLNEVVSETLRDGLMTDLMEKFVPAYAAVYSEEELLAVVEFYESPVGQSVMRKMPLLGPAAARIASEEMPRIQAEMLKRFEAKIAGMNEFGK